MDEEPLGMLEELIKRDNDLIKKVTGISCSLQQILSVPKKVGFLIAVTLFTIPEGMNITKLGEAKSKTSVNFRLFGSVEDDDVLKPGEYIEVSVYKDVNCDKQKPSQYTCLHNFFVCSPIKFPRMPK